MALSPEALVWLSLLPTLLLRGLLLIPGLIIADRTELRLPDVAGVISQVLALSLTHRHTPKALVVGAEDFEVVRFYFMV
jgi:hypothetical protein